MPPAAPNHDDAAALHQQLVARLQQAGYLASPGLLAAFQAVPRHYFLPERPLREVYQDRAIAVKRSQGIPISSSSQPTMMAIALTQLEVQPGQRVLEIGAGTGYNAALLGELVGDQGRVVAVDYDGGLAATARDRLQGLGYRQVQIEQADGFYGYAPGAPYDRILLSTAAWDLAPAWRQQLRPQGRLVLPLVLAGSTQIAIALQPEAEGWRSSTAIPCSFMPLRGTAPALAPPRSVALAPGLTLWTRHAPPVTGEQLRTWLANPGPVIPTGQWLRAAELDYSLRFWLVLQDPYFGEVLAERPLMTLPAALRPWVQRALTGRSLFTVDATGGAALVLEPPSGSDSEGELAIASFGAGAARVASWQQQLQAWEQRGRPAPRGLRLRAYPQPCDRQPGPGETVIDKPWSRLLLTHAQF